MTVLNVTRTATFNASGRATVSIGPEDFPGTKSWHVTGVVLKTSRPGVAPIPAVDIYLNDAQPANIQGTAYDGSRNQGGTDITMNRGMRLIAVWNGGQSGDIAYFTVTGERN